MLNFFLKNSENSEPTFYPDFCFYAGPEDRLRKGLDESIKNNINRPYSKKLYFVSEIKKQEEELERLNQQIKRMKENDFYQLRYEKNSRDKEYLVFFAQNRITLFHAIQFAKSEVCRKQLLELKNFVYKYCIKIGFDIPNHYIWTEEPALDHLTELLIPDSFDRFLDFCTSDGLSKEAKFSFHDSIGLITCSVPHHNKKMNYDLLIQYYPKTLKQSKKLLRKAESWAKLEPIFDVKLTKLLRKSVFEEQSPFFAFETIYERLEHKFRYKEIISFRLRNEVLFPEIADFLYKDGLIDSNFNYCRLNLGKYKKYETHEFLCSSLKVRVTVSETMLSIIKHMNIFLKLLPIYLEKNSYFDKVVDFLQYLVDMSVQFLSEDIKVYTNLLIPTEELREINISDEINQYQLKKMNEYDQNLLSLFDWVVLPTINNEKAKAFEVIFNISYAFYIIRNDHERVNGILNEYREIFNSLWRRIEAGRDISPKSIIFFAPMNLTCEKEYPILDIKGDKIICFEEKLLCEKKFPELLEKENILYRGICSIIYCYLNVLIYSLRLGYFEFGVTTKDECR